MESESEAQDKLKNYYHQMGDTHVVAKNYKSAYVYYTEAAEKYLKASGLAKRQELVDSLKEKCETVIKKAEI